MQRFKYKNTLEQKTKTTIIINYLKDLEAIRELELFVLLIATGYFGFAWILITSLTQVYTIYSEPVSQVLLEPQVKTFILLSVLYFPMLLLTLFGFWISCYTNSDFKKQGKVSE